jgi:predicted secreted protein
MALAGHPVKVYAKSTGATPTASDEVDGINNVTYSPKVDLLDVTDFKDTSGAKLKLAGLIDGSISLSGDYEPTDAPQSLLRTSMTSGASVWLSVHFNPSGTTGTKGFIVECKVESFEVSAAVDGKAEFSCSLQFTGAPAVDS